MHEPETILAHQFDDLGQQKNAATLGMWAFLATEVMFFGGMFLGYAVYRARYPEAFALASREENWIAGAINTGVLLCSSLTMALAVRAGHMGRKGTLIGFLVATIILGLTFIGIKAFEYHHIIETNHAPWANFVFDPLHLGPARIFYSFYFTMTGLHAAHMVVGVGMMSVLIAMAARGRFSRQYYTPVEMIGLYWHFVDIVWIFLFPLFYLIDRSR